MPSHFRHPFSLTSGPEDDHLAVHIRSVGDWSYQIYSLFQEVEKLECQNQTSKNYTKQITKKLLWLQAILSGSKEYPKIYIDGPYGASSQDHVKYDVVMLIGLGIGATPFISILNDVANGLRKTCLDHVICLTCLCILL